MHRLSYFTATTASADEDIVDAIKTDLGITDTDFRMYTVVLWTETPDITVKFNPSSNPNIKAVPLRDNGSGSVYEINTESMDVLTKELTITQSGTEYFITYTF